MAKSRKVMVHRKERMSEEGAKKWSPKLRKKVHPYVFKNLGSFQMPYSACKSEEDFAEWLFGVTGHGYFYIYIWREGYYKDDSRLRPYKIAEVELEEQPDRRYNAKYHDMSRIKRFKWWGVPKKDRRRRRR